MKNSILKLFSLLLFCGIISPVFAQEELKKLSFTKTEAEKLLASADAKLVGDLKKQGFKTSTILENTRYQGRDKEGEFEITVVAREFKGSNGSTVEESLIRIKRGNMVETLLSSDNGSKVVNYSGGGGGTPSVGACDPYTQCARSVISTASSCSNCVSAVANCINAYKGKKGRVWKTTVCLLSNAVGKCLGCVGNFSAMVACIANCNAQN